MRPKNTILKMLVLIPKLPYLLLWGILNYSTNGAGNWSIVRRYIICACTRPCLYTYRSMILPIKQGMPMYLCYHWEVAVWVGTYQLFIDHRATPLGHTYYTMHPVCCRETHCPAYRNTYLTLALVFFAAFGLRGCLGLPVSALLVTGLSRSVPLLLS